MLDRYADNNPNRRWKCPCVLAHSVYWSPNADNVSLCCTEMGLINKRASWSSFCLWSAWCSVGASRAFRPADHLWCLLMILQSSLGLIDWFSLWSVTISASSVAFLSRVFLGEVILTWWSRSDGYLQPSVLLALCVSGSQGSWWRWWPG